MTRLRLTLGLLGMLGFLGVLLLAAGTRAETTSAPEGEAVVNDKQFHERLLKIAAVYTAYGRIDDEFRWAPWLCRMPMPAQAYHSRSSDKATHGQKLYSLFARERNAYVEGSKPGPVGQIIVKESWVPKEVAEKPKWDHTQTLPKAKSVEVKLPDDLAPRNPGLSVPTGDHFYPFAEKEGKWYRADRRGDLFIMMKLDPKTAGTDDGWVYGTVTTNGKTVTSAGRVASCMKCHETRKDRLFGLKPAGEGKKSLP